jgi:hypothetical protein
MRASSVRLTWNAILFCSQVSLSSRFSHASGIHGKRFVPQHFGVRRSAGHTPDTRALNQHTHLHNYARLDNCARLDGCGR